MAGTEKIKFIYCVFIVKFSYLSMVTELRFCLHIYLRYAGFFLRLTSYNLQVTAKVMNLDLKTMSVASRPTGVTVIRPESRNSPPLLSPLSLTCRS
jgi:hypothetical protein